ncbi:hypothetical protein RCOM_0574280 [Ricinus communis]|uniref:NAC domain-containing protein n=1 Tax=Ricinus communis TaxID=3988 RepID=B9SUT1_RICCO|nr:hypothetical protein RCOM_0574280 [Ricinus communis]|eukprot:XP_002529750.1 uncharacterized protein LOC8264289 [Ricinus communis]
MNLDLNLTAQESFVGLAFQDSAHKATGFNSFDQLVDDRGKGDSSACTNGVELSKRKRHTVEEKANDSIVNLDLDLSLEMLNSEPVEKIKEHDVPREAMKPVNQESSGKKCSIARSVAERFAHPEQQHKEGIHTIEEKGKGKIDDGNTAILDLDLDLSVSLEKLNSEGVEKNIEIKEVDVPREATEPVNKESSRKQDFVAESCKHPEEQQQAGTRRELGEVDKELDDSQISFWSTLPPGYIFHPSDKVLVSYYLFHKVKHMKLSEVDNRTVPVCDLYGDKEPWELWDEFAQNLLFTDGDLYFFTQLKGKPRIPRILRTVGNKGTWQGESSKEIAFRGDVDPGDKVWSIRAIKKRFRYKSQNKCNQHRRWIMHEFSLPSISTDWVLCRLVKK